MILEVLFAIAIWRIVFHHSEEPDYSRIREIVRQEIEDSRKRRIKNK